MARKDAKHALDIAEASGTKMKSVEVADNHLHDVQKHMGSKGDIAGICEFFYPSHFFLLGTAFGLRDLFQELKIPGTCFMTHIRS